LPYKFLTDIPKQVREFSPGIPTAKKNKKIIFLLRQNPAGVGGVQRLSTILTEGLAQDYDIQKIIWKGPDWAMPLSFAQFYYKATRSDAELVHCDDAFTCLIGGKIRSATNKIMVGAVHGLDLILPIPWYQKQLRAALQKFDKITTISRASAEQAKKRGVDQSRIAIIPPAGETAPTLINRDERLYNCLEHELGIDLRQKKVLISIGRPVKRKGFDSFITDVFPHLPDDYIYIIAGPKPSTPLGLTLAKPILSENLYHCLRLAAGSYSMHDDLVRLSHHPRIFYLNGVSENLRNNLYAAADLFIMPNKTVEGDMEGFGLVVLEAAARGVPVVATGIEGILDAVIDGENGFCVPEGDNGAMLGIIMALLDDPLKLATLKQRAMDCTKKRFAPERIFSLYNKLFEELFQSRDQKIRKMN
jgi:glycosyltransferase involved in cell wall biosynthesis